MTTFDHVDPIKGLSPDVEELAKYFTKIITSEHNQHAIVMFVGQAGTGKSWAATKLALEVSKKVAEKMGGIPEDYFNFKDTFATINREEVKRVMTKPKKNTILLLDDIGVGWNARKYKDEFNIFLNDVIQTFRPNHNLVIMTMQASFLIDKVPRSLAHYLIEMEDQRFDQGFTMAKVFKIILKHRLGKLYYAYLTLGGVRYYRYLFPMPPKKLMVEYETMRAAQLQKLEQIKEENMEETVRIPKNKLLINVWKNMRLAGFSLREIGKLTDSQFSHVSEELKKLDMSNKT